MHITLPHLNGQWEEGVNINGDEKSLDLGRWTQCNLYPQSKCRNYPIKSYALNADIHIYTTHWSLLVQTRKAGSDPDIVLILYTNIIIIIKILHDFCNEWPYIIDEIFILNSLSSRWS